MRPSRLGQRRRGKQSLGVVMLSGACLASGTCHTLSLASRDLNWEVRTPMFLHKSLMPIALLALFSLATIASAGTLLSDSELGALSGGTVKYRCDEDGLCHVGAVCSSTSSITDSCTVCGKSLLGVFWAVTHYKCQASQLAWYKTCQNGLDPSGCGNQRTGHCDGITTGPFCNIDGGMTGGACTESRRTCTLGN